MANINKVAGLTPVKYLNGAKWTGQGNIYSIASDNTDAMYVGDPVTLSGTGDTLGIPGIGIGVAGATCVGVIVAVGTIREGAYINPADLTKVYAPATKASVYYALVVDDPNVVFEIQESGTALAATDIGLNANFVIAAPSTGGVLSGTYLGNSTKNTTSTLNLKLLGLARRSDNVFGTYAKWNVLLNNHVFRTGVAGV